LLHVDGYSNRSQAYAAAVWRAFGDAMTAVPAAKRPPNACFLKCFVMNPSPPHDVAVFVVHLWPSGAEPAGFRAAVRRVDRDETQVFTQGAALADYFRGQAQSAGVRDNGPASLDRPRE
jgi:hypothetical protein